MSEKVELLCEVTKVNPRHLQNGDKLEITLSREFDTELMKDLSDVFMKRCRVKIEVEELEIEVGGNETEN